MSRPPKRCTRFVREVSNDLWQIDAIEVRLSSQKKVYVLDTIDDHSRPIHRRHRWTAILICDRRSVEGRMKFMINYDDASRRQAEIVEASTMVDRGHEGRWIDFLDVNEDLVLRIRSADVARIEHVGDDAPGEPPPGRDVPDLSRVLA